MAEDMEEGSFARITLGRGRCFPAWGPAPVGPKHAPYYGPETMDSEKEVLKSRS